MIFFFYRLLFMIDINVSGICNLLQNEFASTQSVAFYILVKNGSPYCAAANIAIIGIIFTYDQYK